MVKKLLFGLIAAAASATAVGCHAYVEGPAVYGPDVVVGPAFGPYYGGPFYGGYGYGGGYGYRGYYGHGFRGPAFRGGGYHGGFRR